MREFADHLNAIADPTPFDDGILDRLEGLIFGAKPVCHILVARVDGHNVGYLAYFFGADLETLLPTLHVADLFVRQNARGQGIGGCLMRQAQAVISGHGGDTVHWQVWRKNPAAIAFYRKLGGTIVDEEIPMKWTKTAGSAGTCQMTVGTTV